MKTVLKTAVFVFGLLALVFASFPWYFYLTYLDETAVEGSAHGYTIGQLKPDAYAVATDQFENGQISGIHIMEPFETFDPAEASFETIQRSDLWTLFPDERGDFFDSLKLHFNDGKLVKIHRHRQRFELP